MLPTTPPFATPSPAINTQMPSKRIGTACNGGGVRLVQALPPANMPNHAHQQQRNIVQSTYTIHNHNLQTNNTAKYLGIHVHMTLNWNTHIKKTAQRENQLQPSSTENSHMPTQNQTPSLHTLVRPILEYSSIIWDPHTASHIHRLETEQRRSARQNMHNYNIHASVTPILQHLHLPYTTTTQRALQNHHAIQNHTPTSQHSNCHLHHSHTIH